MLKRLRITTLAAALCGATTLAGELSFTGAADKPLAIYKPGEKIVFSVRLLDDSKPVAGKKLKWVRRGDDKLINKGEAVSSATQPLNIETSSDKPGFVHIAVTVFNDDGKPAQDAKNQDVRFDGGAGVELGKLEGYPEPKDFDAFWVKQKNKLAKVPLKASLTEFASKNQKVLVFDVKVDCAGKKPVSGYFSKPKGAAVKSLPAQVNFMGAGVMSASPEMQATNKLVFNINAHGIENGKDAEYYKKLQEGELKDCYAFNKEANSNPETAYFNGMMLRVLRSLEFIKAQPEWDGRNVVVSGGSQGGFQALVAAGLDADVTKCFAYKPWCCDLGGVNLGRIRGDWRPDYTDALAYYDPVNHAKRIKCETVLLSGLGDYVCPPSGITVVYNNIKAPKQIEYTQGATHGYYPPNPKSFTLSNK